jgi:chromosome segregation ATPase
VPAELTQLPRTTRPRKQKAAKEEEEKAAEDDEVQGPPELQGEPAPEWTAAVAPVPQKSPDVLELEAQVQQLLEVIASKETEIEGWIATQRTTRVQMEQLLNQYEHLRAKANSLSVERDTLLMLLEKQCSHKEY